MYSVRTVCVQRTVYSVHQNPLTTRHGGRQKEYSKSFPPRYSTKLFCQSKNKNIFFIFVICHNLLPTYWCNFARLNLIRTGRGGCWWNQWQYIEIMLVLKSRKRHRHVEDCSIAHQGNLSFVSFLESGQNFWLKMFQRFRCHVTPNISQWLILL